MTARRKAGWAALAVASVVLAACEPVPNVRPGGEGPVSVPVPLPEGSTIVITDLPPEDRAPLGKTPNVTLGPESDVLTAGQVLDRLRARLIQPACIVGPNNTRWRRKYAGYPQHFADQITAILPRMLVVLDQLEARKLPAEFAVVPIVESWYRLDVRTTFGGAAGMWQFLAQTARNNGGTVTADFDGRASMLDSTLAAMNYLDALQSMFNDWRLAAMAYNSGEYRLAKTMTSDELAARGAGSAIRYRRPWGLAFGTYEYVSKMRALVCLLDQPERQGIPLDPTVPITHWVPYDVPAGIDSLDDLAQRLGTDAQALKDFNGGYRNGRIGADAPRKLLVPASTRSRWAAVAAGANAAPSPASSTTTATGNQAATTTTTPPMATPAAADRPSAPPAQILLPPMPATTTKPATVPSAPPPAPTPATRPATGLPAPGKVDAQAKPAASPAPAPIGTATVPTAANGSRQLPPPTTSAQPSATANATAVVVWPSPPPSPSPAVGSFHPLAPASSATEPPRQPTTTTTPAATAGAPTAKSPAHPSDVQPPMPSPKASVAAPTTATPIATPPAPATTTPATPAHPPPATAPAAPHEVAPPPPAAPAAPAASTTGAAAAPATAASASGTAAPPAHSPRTCKVELGDSLDSIAARFGVKAADLRKWNHLAIDATLYVDQVLQLEP